MSNTTCKNCLHSQRRDHLSQLGPGLDCHAMPPSVFPVGTQSGVQIISAFPPVLEDMSCSLFEPDIGETIEH